MFRSLLKILSAVGLVSMAAGGIWYYRINHPRNWSLDEAKKQTTSSQKWLVTIAAQPVLDDKWYNRKPNEVTRERPRLARRSPADGVDLLATPRQDWPSLEGDVVRASVQLKVAQERIPIGAQPQLKSNHIMLTTALTPHEKLLDRTPISARRILAYLGDHVWVLSGHFPSAEGAGNSLHFLEAEWAEQPNHRGILHRCQDHLSKVVAENHGLAEDWVIDEGEKVQFNQHGGYYMYVPVQGTEQKIWVQVPLEEDGNLQSRLGDAPTGVWIPAGSHKFVPSNEPDARADDIALLQWGEWSQRRYTDDQTGPALPMFGGLMLLVLSVMVLFITAPGAAAENPPPRPSS